MTGSTLLLLLVVGRRTALSDRILAQESAGARDLGSVRTVLRRVAAFTLIAEGIGAIALGVAFAIRYGDAAKGAWYGVFHSISAFNNAGFDLFGGFHSLGAFASDPLVLVPLAVLIVLGGLGVAIVGDIAAKRGWIRLALETKLVVVMTVALVVGGMLALLVFEWSNPATLGALPPAQRPLNALFESIAFRSAGMTTIPIGQLTGASLLVGIALMFIGTASGSTGGGIKLTTFSILLGVDRVDRPRPPAHRGVRPARVASHRLSRAVGRPAVGRGPVRDDPAAPDHDPVRDDILPIAFETVSAFGTVGDSTGITPTLPDTSLLVLIVTMFVGRLGPLTFALAARGAFPGGHRAARARDDPDRLNQGARMKTSVLVIGLGASARPRPGS